MSEVNNTSGSAAPQEGDKAGSPDNLIQSGPQANGQPDNTSADSGKNQEVDLDNYVPKDQYEELSKKIGEQVVNRQNFSCLIRKVILQ